MNFLYNTRSFLESKSFSRLAFSLCVFGISSLIAVTFLEYFNPWKISLENLFQYDQYKLEIDTTLQVVIFLCVFAFSIFLVTAPPSRFLKKIALIFSLIALVRYMKWRFSTIYAETSWSWIICILFFLAEATDFFLLGLTMLQALSAKSYQRSEQANNYQRLIAVHEYQPSVDIFVTTYNESESIVRKTLFAACSIEYKNKKIHLLDDGHRLSMKQLAEELNVNYISRTSNEHRKAGNLNNALKLTEGDLIAVFDADFIPFKNFLNRTIGFFMDQKVAILQTPQHYYNSDINIKNLGLDHLLPHDLAYFYDKSQPIRDSHNAVICCGTSYVIRRSALESIGGYYTECIIEDYQTSTRLLTRGHKVIFLNEVLSLGEVPRSTSEYVEQRLRWLQGNFQIYFHLKDLPIWTNLSLMQKSFYLQLLLYTLMPIYRSILIVLPVISVCFGFALIWAPWYEYLSYMAPFFVLSTCSMIYYSDREYFPFWTVVYEALICFRGSLRLIRVLLQPMAHFGRHVTKKGSEAIGLSFNLQLTWIHWSLLFLMISVYIIQLLELNSVFTSFYDRTGASIAYLWSAYSVLILFLSALSAIDVPDRRVSDRFLIKTVASVQIFDQRYWGVTTDLSESGCRLQITSFSLDPVLVNQQSKAIKLKLMDQDIDLEALIRKVSRQDQQLILGLEFINISLTAQQKLTQLIYSDNPYLREIKRPGAVDALLHLIRSIFIRSESAYQARK